MNLAEFFKHSLRIFVQLQLFRDLIEVRLILVQIGPANFQQLIQRQIHHLVVFKLFRESLSANAEVAVRLRKQIRLQPVEVIRKRGDHSRIRLRKFSFERRVFGIGKGQRHIVLKETHNVRQLFDGNLGKNTRRIFQVHTRIGQQHGHLPFARYQRTQPLVW